MPLFVDTIENKLIFDALEKSIFTTAKIMSNNLEIFEIVGGPIELKTYLARCITDNDGTASTFKLYADATVGGVTDICGVSGSLALAVAGTIINLVGGALATGPVITPTGAAISQLFPILVPTGTLKLTIAGGSTTGTWIHHLRYMPLSPKATVIASF